ncbi:MAG: hypothetical protein ACI85O_001939 [Saprospiraceae bacterium]|jgi:hypothetical protein
MKIQILTLLFGLLWLPASAQNFYVMRIEGEVTLNGKLLKKRDKVKQNSRLIFSDLEARIHLVSAKGNYKLTGSDVDVISQNEFLLELSNDYLASYSKSSSSTYSLTRYGNINPPYYNYLLSPQTKLPVPSEKKYILKAVAADTTYRINLEETEGAITLIPDYFTSQDTSLLWKVFATDAEIDSLSLYTFKNPEWENPEKVIRDFKNRIDSTSIDWDVHNLRAGYLLNLYNQQKYLPDTLLGGLIKKRIHWYHFNSRNTKTAVITPSEIAYKDLEGKVIDTHFYLAKLMGDTVFVHFLRRINKGFYLTKSDFTSLDMSAPSENFRGFAIITSREEIQHPGHAKVLYRFYSPVFIELADIKKDIKFLKKKLKLKDTKDAEELQKDILMTEYGSELLWSEGILQTTERDN